MHLHCRFYSLSFKTILCLFQNAATRILQNLIGFQRSQPWIILTINQFENIKIASKPNFVYLLIPERRAGENAEKSSSSADLLLQNYQKCFGVL